MDECPVCYSECKRTVGIESFYVCEEYVSCPHECYAYEFSYGSSRVHSSIRGQHVEFYWHYTDPGTDFRHRNDAINLVADCARRVLLEDLLKLKEPREDSKATA